MEAPKQVQDPQPSDYLEVMSKAIFQTGISWAVVEKKWDGTRVAFRNFEPLAVASLTEAEIIDLTTDTRIIRNRKKIEAIVDNARKLVELDEKHGGFTQYLKSHGGFEETVKDLRNNFRFLGETGAFYFLYVVGEPVPAYEDWCRSRGVTPVHA